MVTCEGKFYFFLFHMGVYRLFCVIGVERRT